MTTGEKITAGRKKLNLTQTEFADRLGVTRQAVSRWEGDFAFPETDTLIKISELFGCSTDYLLKYGEEEKDKEQSAEQKERSFNLLEWHFEYKSERKVCGMPLVHVNIGWGRKATGFFSVGFAAKGIFSVGFASMGVISFGFVSLGAVALGCASLGLLAFGAIVLGLLAFGGVAVGIIAYGGLAVGCYACGGATFGLFACGGYANGYYVAVGDYAVGRIAFGKSTAIGGEFSVTPENFDELRAEAFLMMDELPGIWRWFIEFCKAFARGMMSA